MSARIRRRRDQFDGPESDFGYPLSTWPYATYCVDCGRDVDYICVGINHALLARAQHNRLRHNHRTVVVSRCTGDSHFPWGVQEFTWGDDRDESGRHETWAEAMQHARIILSDRRDALGKFHGLLVSDASPR